MPALEDRVQRLEDIAAIRRLKYEYARQMDAGISGRVAFPQDALMDLFTDDAVWESSYYDRFEGKQTIRDFYARVGPHYTFALHYMVGSTIDIAPSGTEASGHWYTLETLTLKGGAVWLAATYDDVYKKVDGRWLFQQVKATTYFMTPYESGWVKEPFAVE